MIQKDKKPHSPVMPQKQRDYQASLFSASQTDCHEIENSVKRSLQKRKEIISLLETLEEAWKTAVSQELQTLKQFEDNDKVSQIIFQPASQKTSKTLSETLENAQNKKREALKLESQIFHSFESLTKLKFKEQISLAEKILSSLPAKDIDQMLEITSETQLFFEKENKINKMFLQSTEDLSSKTELFLLEIDRVLAMRCEDQVLESLLEKDLKLLRNFLKATKKLFNG
jgi:hypothetical protein